MITTSSHGTSGERQIDGASGPPARFTIVDLPTEVLVLVLGQLGDLTSLSSAVVTCQRVAGAFISNRRQVVLDIIAALAAKVRGHNLGDLLWQVGFAIRWSFIPRDVIVDAFTLACPIFSEYQSASLLFPLFRALARSYLTLGNDPAEDRNAAVDLLRRVWNHHEPFSFDNAQGAQHVRSPCYLSVGSLLYDLTSSGEKNTLAMELARLDSMRTTPDGFDYQAGQHGIQLQIHDSLEPLAFMSMRCQAVYAFRLKSTGDDGSIGIDRRRRRVWSFQMSNSSSSYSYSYCA
jgi:hypothetical protein